MLLALPGSFRCVVFLGALCSASTGCRDTHPRASASPAKTSSASTGSTPDTAKARVVPETVAAVLQGDGTPTGYPDSFFAKIPNGAELLPDLYEVYLSRPATTIKPQPAYTMVYVPKAEWRDTLNALAVHRDSTDASPVVALLGVRKNGTGWQRVFVTRAKRVLGALQRVSDEEWALGVDDRFGAWALVPYAYARSGTMRGWVHVIPPRVAVREAERAPRDTVRAHLASAERYRALIPDSVLIRRKACPFECCTYRDWKATHEIPVYRNEMDTGNSMFELRTGESFHALTGNVHITGIVLIAVHRRLLAGQLPPLLPGDTVVLLNSLGESFYNVWKKDGQVIPVEADWSGPPWTASPNRALGNYDTQWWVNIRTFSGRVGWIRADSARFTNADACG